MAVSPAGSRPPHRIPAASTGETALINGREATEWELEVLERAWEASRRVAADLVSITHRNQK